MTRGAIRFANRIRDSWLFRGGIHERCPQPDEVPAVRDAISTTSAPSRSTRGTRWGILGDIGELFVNKEKFDVYVCKRCGRVELFVDGIGEEFRPH